MQIPLSWLRDYVDLDGIDVEKLCDDMTMLGLEIEAVERIGEGIQGVVVGKILSIEPHPDADKLVVCKTDVGSGEPAQIICGAKNMKVGDKVPTAVVGATLPGDFKIGKRKMRGVESQGMMCSPRELGLGDDHEGLMILDGDLPIGEDFRKAFGLDDVVIEIEVTPNRNDWAGLIGVARELSAAYGIPLKLPDIAVEEAAEDAAAVSSVTIEDPDLCPRYAGRVLRGVRIGPSPGWLQQRLRAAGQRPINNVVDVTNYVLLETGQPLHAFDLDKLNERRIVVRRAAKDETLKSIDQETRTLSTDMLVIADGASPVAIAGVMGGYDSEVGEGTTNVFLESAYFDPVSVRRTARALNMATEASQRFQRGADPDMVTFAADRASRLMLETAGGTLLRGTLDEYPRPIEPGRVALRFERANALLGATVPPETQCQVIERLGFELCKQDDAQVEVGVPPRRHDCTREADLIEEVARLFGYDNIPVTIPRVRPTPQEFDPEFATLRALRNQLTSLGLFEAVTWSFSNPEEIRDAGMDNGFSDMVALQNPLSENYATLRTTLVPAVLRVVSTNLRNHRHPVRVFEVAPVYQPVAGAALPTQSYRLAIAIASRGFDKHWSRPQYPADIYDLKGYAEVLLASFDAGDASFLPRDMPLYERGQAATISAGENEVGFLGSVAKPVLERFDIDQPVYLMELNLQNLLKAPRPLEQYQEVPAYPPSLRDLAVLVDRATPAGAVQATAQKAGGKLLADVRIFDVYTGEQIPADKKSVALSLTFQSLERTLTDKDTEKAVKKIVSALERELGAQLR